ncbi:monoacyl phosphatidylinositol tetramannoside-binding protein [Rhodococcus sp. 05-340-1]|uniref:ABC transporter family substrate-binding protein n=1 Tax=unclassified Rhodococcus (in: high G+C Gram-positive bacteria) TaxID=192944 RepID=UPI000B9C451F|nr:MULTISPECIES: ABC transporter family substrate-binding protein [unclassified Rhodococcus (in: high G+C Gram-positive bacteria)]OZD68086.1 monoacyl phosphatidylinositol tetramannoside-binding protein [Rhodococcus sp. 05-340-2]OZD85093.1 monoacyl phosphatidylinositol tetramannoside-binding protein [Rhodococcus sp. 05-340-1]
MPTVLVSAIALVLTACTADPPPPIESVETPVSTTMVPAETGDPVVVAIDDVGIGFNPHLQADQSPATAAVSSLVLPSPFRPVRNPDTGVTTWEPDLSLLISAEVTSQSPFTIRYQLRNEAQWSDSAPIAAEDFRYLWQQMITQPGVVDPAGYALISDVASSGGGKTVDVTLSAQYPAWQRLFADLVPSHLLKDSPGGFQGGLTDNVPVSGSRFNIKTVDRGRDEILLERNDRFWDRPASPDQILIRRGGTSAQLADSLRSSDAQIAQVRGGSALRAQLSAIPGVRTDTIRQSRVLSMTVNGRAPNMSDSAVRQGIFGLLDPNLLATVGAGGGATDLRAAAQLSSPSDPGYSATAPAPIGRTAALDLLDRAGFVPTPDAVVTSTPNPSATTTAAPTTSPDPTSTGAPAPSVTRLADATGTALRFVIGAVENDDIALAVAGTAADELIGAGIDATVTPLPADELYSTALTDGTVDAVVGWTSAGVDPATALASRFGCVDEPADGSGNGVEVPRNLSGLCVPELQPTIDRALVSGLEPSVAIDDVEPKLWSLASTLPIMQDSSVVAAVPGITGVSLTGPVEVGIFSDATQWMRTPR